MDRMKQLREMKEYNQSMVEEQGDVWSRNVVALDWAIDFVKEVQRERKQTFAARWQQATRDLRKHSGIIKDIMITQAEGGKEKKKVGV